MGLFDKLIKDGIDAIKNLASEENKEKASAALDSLKEKFEDIKETLSSNSAGNASEYASVPASGEDIYTEPDDGLTCRQRLLNVLRDEFPRYTVRENVSPAEIVGTGRFMNYSIAVYDGDVPKLFIMIIGKTTTSHREYRWSREEAEKRGYAFFNFVEHYPNRPEYISARLHTVL